MDKRLARSAAVVMVAAGLWALGTAHGPAGTGWVHSPGAAPGPVRILRFYSTVGWLKAGEKAQLCYAVENARRVRIAPLLEGAFPLSNRCLEVLPEHTTHYTILAEGFDGHVAMQSLTLAVGAAPGDAPNLQLVAQTTGLPGTLPDGHGSDAGLAWPEACPHTTAEPQPRHKHAFYRGGAEERRKPRNTRTMAG